MPPGQRAARVLFPMTTDLALTNSIQTAVSDLAARLTTDIAPTEKAVLFGELKLLEDIIKDVVTLARDRVLEYVKEHGSPITENGTLQARLGDYLVEATVRNTGFDPKKVMLLLRHRGLDPEAGCDATVTYKPNANKLTKLASDGVLHSRELELCRFDREYNLKRPVKTDE